MPDGPSVEETLGSISLLSDTIPKHDTRKLDSGGARLLASAGDLGPDELSGAEARAPRRQPRRRVPSADAGGPVRPGTDEGFYMLATYCFDLQRKMEYLYKVTRAFALQGDPALARQLLEDERQINGGKLSWKERALRAEARMLELQEEIGAEHRQLVKRVARRRPRGGSGEGRDEA